MSLPRVQDFLDSYRIHYVTIAHSVAYTAQGVAAVANIPGKELAKTVILNIDGQLSMVVLPASAQVDLGAVARMTNARRVDLASEEEFRRRFPDCETGAMPPFGNLYGMPVFADESLTNDDEIAFNAGSHRELIRMAWSDYVWLAHPAIVELAMKPALA
jgi:Ala-tRNA(Pro) deacylase